MIRFKMKAIEKLLEERKPQIPVTSYLHIRKVIDRSAEGMGTYALSNICRDLECLPSDIVEYI